VHEYNPHRTAVVRCRRKFRQFVGLFEEFLGYLSVVEKFMRPCFDKETAERFRVYSLTV